MCSACLTRHGDGWDVHGHPILPWGRSRTYNPVREGQRLCASASACDKAHSISVTAAIPVASRSATRGQKQNQSHHPDRP